MAGGALWPLAGGAPERDRRPCRVGVLGGRRTGRGRRVSGVLRRCLAAVVLGFACSVNGCGGGQHALGSRPAGIRSHPARSYRWLVRTAAPRRRSPRRTGPAARADGGWPARPRTSEDSRPGPSGGYVARADAAPRAAAEHLRQRAGLAPGHDPDLPDGLVRRARADVRCWSAGRLPVLRSRGCRHSAAHRPDRVPLAPDSALPHPRRRCPAACTSPSCRRATGASDCLFVVRSRRPQPLLAQLPTATYEAYNAWGGDSLYPGGRA